MNSLEYAVDEERTLRAVAVCVRVAGEVYTNVTYIVVRVGEWWQHLSAHALTETILAARVIEET